MEKWVTANASAWEELEKEYDLKPGAIENAGWDMMDYMLSFDTDRIYDNTARRMMGFDEEADSIPSFKQAFQYFAQFKLIPPL